MGELTVKPLRRGAFKALEELFSCRGGSVVRRCWCMFYRQPGGEFKWGDPAKRSMKRLVDRGTVPGLIGYLAGKPVGWISLGPRTEYRKLERSPVMKAVDETPVWSVICFFVDPRARGKNVTARLLDAAIAYARKKGARVLESYPVDKPGKQAPENLWFGTKRLFERAGFKVVLRRKPTRPIMRLELSN